MLNYLLPCLDLPAEAAFLSAVGTGFFSWFGSTQEPLGLGVSFFTPSVLTPRYLGQTG